MIRPAPHRITVLEMGRHVFQMEVRVFRLVVPLVTELSPHLRVDLSQSVVLHEDLGGRQGAGQFRLLRVQPYGVALLVYAPPAFSRHPIVLPQPEVVGLEQGSVLLYLGLDSRTRVRVTDRPVARPWDAIQRVARHSRIEFQLTFMTNLKSTL